MSKAYCHIFIFFLLIQISGNTASDKDVLLELKSFLQSTNRVNQGRYALWDETAKNPCSWHGVTCNSFNQVTGLYLNDSIIAGKIYANFSKLTYLTHLDLSNNTIEGSIPFNLNKCVNLRYLNLSHNLISGQLNLFNLTWLKILDVTLNRLDGELSPNFPSLCTSLVTLNVSMNNFTGRVTGLFDKCLKLKHLDLSSNQFYGEIWKGFEKLEEFSVAENNLSGVILPGTFSSKCNMQSLDLSANALDGTFPNSISNCKNLTVLNLSGNHFNGAIPNGLGMLSDLTLLFLGNNSFDRDIPNTLLDCKKLAFIDLSRNNYGGEIQPIFGKFTGLRFLLLHSNSYSNGIESSGILSLPNLERLDLSFNNLSGQLPVQFSEMPKLKFLILAHNSFSGNIPSEYGSMTSLQALDISFNNVSGNIPKSFGNLTSLLWLMLANNQLAGSIPEEIGNCKSLLWLNLANNSLSGNIPASITRIGSDPESTFEKNRIDDVGVPAGSGECLTMKRWIPASYPPFSFIYTLMTRKSCRDTWNKLLKGYGLFPICLNNSSRIMVLKISGYLQLSSNQLSGTIPDEIGTMRHISLLHLDMNRLYGHLPGEIGNLPLVVFNMSKNNLSGEIPTEIGSLKCLQSLDISYNNLSGNFADSLNQLSDLNLFNASYNPLLSGMVPISGQIATFGPDSYIGDPLIQFIAGTRSSPPPKMELSGPRRTAWTVAGWILLAVLVVLVIWGCLCFLIYWFSNLDKRGASKIFEDVKVFGMGNVSFSYSDIVKATGNFSEDMEIGRGGYGIVYKGVLPDGRHVAVKKLQSVGCDGEREFRAEMEALSDQTGFGWPHPNLIVLYGWCISGTEKILVYEYMEGGSLEDVITDWNRFGWDKRLTAAVEIANALVFLHHECEPVIVHRDVKASNVLLDGVGRAKMTDFGLARMVGMGESHVSTMVAGTVGYVAPEYGITGRATTKGDVYSFGVLLMELVTGRSAIDENECLVEWVRRVGIREVVESVVRIKEGKRVIEMWGAMKVAMWCTDNDPCMRPDMREVLAMLRSFWMKYDFSSSSGSSVSSKLSALSPDKICK